MFIKNDEKYKNATKDFVTMSVHIYNKMNEFLDFSTTLVNPIVCKVF